MTRVLALALALALSGCSAFRAAEKDPAAAVATAKYDAARTEKALVAACTEFELAESKGLVPAGPVKSDADAFCAALRAVE